MENLHTTTSSEPMERKLTLNNNIEEIPLLANFIDSVAEEAGIDFATAMSLNLALEEAVVKAQRLRKEGRHVALRKKKEGTE